MDKNTKKIIEFAINNEIEAYEFYDNAAQKVDNSQLKETFEDLAGEEENHRTHLRDFLEEELSKMKIEDVNDYKIAETVEAPKLSTDMRFSDAIALAMKKEQEAMDMYQKLSDISEDPEQKELFDELVKMERKHKVRLEGIYNNAAFVEVW